MKNHFSEFLPRRLGQTEEAPGFLAKYIYPHLAWMIVSGLISGFLSWKLCKAYCSGLRLFDRVKNRAKEAKDSVAGLGGRAKDSVASLGRMFSTSNKKRLKKNPRKPIAKVVRPKRIKKVTKPVVDALNIDDIDLSDL